ncbi:hypothetical protein GGH92_005677, partial [Coemansia sp. RSA 2673]
MNQLSIKVRSVALDLGEIGIKHRSTIDLIPQLTALKMKGIFAMDAPLACPKLGQVMVDPSNAPELNASIADVLQRDAYVKYAER